jgi:hypothetical protein
MGPAKRGVNLETLRQVPSTYAKYALLLPLLLVNLVVFGFQDWYPPLKVLSRWITLAVMVMTLYVSRVGRPYFLAVAALTLFSVGLWESAWLRHGWPRIVLVAAFGALIVQAPIVILRKVWKDFATEGVDAEVVLGALCAYLYIGWWYAYLYRAVAVLSKSNFFAQPGSEDTLNFLYFSFITLTTVGYGDFTPAYGPGRMLAVTEAIVGQLYLVSVVALVVSAYGKRRSGHP